jgi:hypothetical protein
MEIDTSVKLSGKRGDYGFTSVYEFLSPSQSSSPLSPQDIAFKTNTYLLRLAM